MIFLFIDFVIYLLHFYVLFECLFIHLLNFIYSLIAADINSVLLQGKSVSYEQLYSEHQSSSHLSEEIILKTKTFIVHFIRRIQDCANVLEVLHIMECRTWNLKGQLYLDFNEFEANVIRIGVSLGKHSSCIDR